MGKPKKTVKSIIMEDLERSKTILEKKLSKFGKMAESRYYYRRLNKIFNIMKERCFFEVKPIKVLAGADFYQKIELFMNYDKSTYNDDEIYELISQVFKSLYINFLLAYLEEDEYIPLPYIGKIRIKELDRYSNFHKKMIKYFYGVIKLDDQIRKEIKQIEKGLKIEAVNETMAETKRVLTETVG